MSVFDLNIPSARTSRPRIGLMAAFALYRSRRDLAKLDAAQLSDIGLSHSDARKEAVRPVWDVPQNWLK